MLLTHPLPEDRITDSRERARQYPPLKLAPHLDYHLARARIIARYAGIDADAALDWFARSEKKSTPPYSRLSSTAKPWSISISNSSIKQSHC